MSVPQPDADNPIVNLLRGCAFPELAATVKSQIEPIIATWEQQVRQALPTERTLSETQLRDHLPQILTLLADLLAEDDIAETQRLMETPIEHGAVRFQQDYDVRGFVIEYRLLRRVAVERIEAGLGRCLRTDESLALHMGIDDFLQRGVVTFTDHQQSKLRSAGESEAKYLSFLSHDLKNNLNGVTLSLEVLKRRLAQEPDFAEEVDDLHAAQTSILETIDGMNRLLQAERLRQGAAPVVVAFDLHRLVSEVMHRFTRQAERKGLRLTLDIPTGLTIHSDRDWIALVLQNLIGNAIKYSDNGTIAVSCDSVSNDDGNRLVIAVADEGPGIAPEKLSRLFDAFTRGDTHGKGGLGLGLAVASQAAKRLGADLTVESKIGVGSVFRLELPV